MAAYNLRQLRYFVTTAECGSVAEASRKLYIAQPSVSTAIKQLEDSFGVQLFIRHHAQGVSLTPSGARFYRKALELLRVAMSSSRTPWPITMWWPGRLTSVVLKPWHRCTCHA